jgi:hypothetical protein
MAKLAPTGSRKLAHPAAGRSARMGFAATILLIAVACASGQAPKSTPSFPVGSIHNLVAPDLIGDTKPQAEKTLSDLGVVSVSVEVQSSTTAKPGVVISQVPQAGQLISTSTGFDLVVASATSSQHAGSSTP